MRHAVSVRVRQRVRRTGVRAGDLFGIAFVQSEQPPIPIEFRALIEMQVVDYFFGEGAAPKDLILRLAVAIDVHRRRLLRNLSEV